MTLAERIVALARTPTPDDRTLGELNTLLDRHLNTDSTDQMRWFLYGLTGQIKYRERIPNTCDFEPIYIKEEGARTESLATDKTTLLKLWRKTRRHNRAAELLLRIKDLCTRMEYAGLQADADGRIRTSINIVGTKTQRHKSSQTAMGTGGNLHTVSSGHKHLFPADPGYHFFSIDLSGADGWTIASECAVLGDTTMLEDMRYGLKPAQLVALLYKHGAAVNTWPRDQIKAALPSIKDPSWLYFACKVTIWATAYGSGHIRISEAIMEESFDPDSGTDPIYVEPKTCAALQALIYARYPGIRRRQDRIRMLLSRDGYLDFANGSRRTFFGSKDDPSTQRDAFAAHPQVITTWATSLAWERLWLDPENRTCDADPIVQPLLLVHDSLAGQFPIDRTDWACAKLRTWFDNPITIAGHTVTIPYSGHYGPTWAHAGGVEGYPAVGAI